MQIHQDAQQILSKRFKIKRLLGKGSFGNVYQCQQKKNNQLYAIKIIQKLNVKRSKIQCLRQQATLLLSLDHPNIVKVYEFFQDQRVMFIKMQYIKGGTLGQLMKQRQQCKTSFTDEQAAVIMNSIFKAVYYIHSLSILHRDIKPENILVTDKNQLSKLKIADFGLGAKLQFRSPTATSKCGTYLFMAPQIIWNYTYTKAVDIWSCAIIMFMLKKGTHPFYQSKMTNEQFKNKIKNVTFPPLQDTNPQENDLKLSNKDIKLSKHQMHKSTNTYSDIRSSKGKQDKVQLLNKKKSVLAQDLMTRISKLSPNQRYTAQDAIKHPWITRNFDDQIPLSLHDSFVGFQVSHEVSLMLKMFLVLKNMFIKKEAQQKIKKNQIYQKYAKYCQEVNKKDRCVSPLKIRRLSSLNTTKQLRQLCELSSMSISPKKVKKQLKQVQQQADPQNPTIMKLNKIFNNLFDKKQKKQSKTYSQQFMNNLNQNLNQQKCYEYKQIPDITNYKLKIQEQIQKAVKQRNKRKKQRILPLRKKNQYGDIVGLPCQARKSQRYSSKQEAQLKTQLNSPSVINLKGSIFSADTISNTGKIRIRRKYHSTSVNTSINKDHNNKYTT